MSEFEKKLRDKLDNISINDILAGYDKEQDWERLAAKLKPEKTIRPWIWLSHAAAIVLGFFISWLMLHRDANSTTALPLTTAIPQQKIIYDRIHDTIILSQPAPASVRYVVRPAAAFAAKIKEPQKTILNNKPEIKHDIDILKPPVLETIVTAAPQQLQPPLNLLDLDNEDARAIMHSASPLPKGNIITYLYHGQIPPDNGNTTIGNAPSLIHFFKP